MNKRLYLSLILVLISSPILSACSGSEEVNTSATSTKLEVPVFPDAIPDPGKYQDVFQKVFEEFRSLRPDFNIESNIYLIPSVNSDDVFTFFNDALKNLEEGQKDQTAEGVGKFQWMTDTQVVTIYHLPDPTGAENILIVLNAWK